MHSSTMPFTKTSSGLFVQSSHFDILITFVGFNQYLSSYLLQNDFLYGIKLEQLF